MTEEERLPVGAYVASALMAANIPCDSGEDVDRFLNELESRGYAVVPLGGTACPACGGGWWTVGDDSYACNHAAGVSVPTEPGAPLDHPHQVVPGVAVVPAESGAQLTERDTYFFEAGVAEGKRLAATPQDPEA